MPKEGLFSFYFRRGRRGDADTRQWCAYPILVLIGQLSLSLSPLRIYDHCTFQRPHWHERKLQSVQSPRLGPGGSLTFFIRKATHRKVASID